MKVIPVLCLVILSHQKKVNDSRHKQKMPDLQSDLPVKISLANYLRIDNSGKSSLSTEYQARFQQQHCDGANVSEGNIAGNHRFEKSTNEETWEGFASKCASIIHSLVSALTSAVSPVPGDAMNLELNIKNRIFHHDDRQFNACTPAGALPDCGNVPSTAVDPSGIPVGGGTLPFPSSGGFFSPVDDYLGTGAVTLSPDVFSGDNAEQLPLSQPAEDYGALYLPSEATPTPEPTMNTPATRESSYDTTTPNFPPLLDFQNPSFTGPNTDGFPIFDARGKPIDGTQSFPADALPLDNWKPCPNHQTDLISPGTALTDDCSSTSPHLSPGFVTPASLPSGTLPPNSLAWERFYNEHPELLSPNSSPKSRSCSPAEQPPWPSEYDWETYPNPEPDYLPPPPFNGDPSNPLASDGLATPVSPVTDCPPEDVSHGQQLSYLAPVEGKNSFPDIISGDAFGAPNASGNDGLPQGTFANQEPGFVPPFEGENNLPNIVPGDNFGPPLGSGNDFPLSGSSPNEQPGYFPDAEGTGTSNAMPGGFGAPVGPETDCLPEDNFPDQQQGYLPPGSGYGDGILPSQYLGNPAGASADAPLENTFPQQPGYLPPLPPLSFDDAPPGTIPSDSLVTQTAPVADFPVGNSRQNQQPGRLPPPQSLNDVFSDGLPGQNSEGSNWGPYPNQQRGQLPPQPFNGDSSGTIPGQNLNGSLESGTGASNNWDPNQQHGQLPPRPFNDGLSNNLPGQGPEEPVQSGPLPSNNWGPYPSQQLGSILSQPFNDGPSNTIPEQNFGGLAESALPGTGNWSPFPNQLPGGLPQSFDGGSPYAVPGQNLGGPLESDIPGSDNWGPRPNQQPGQLPPQPFDGDSSNAIPGQSLGGPVESGPLASNNWGPYPSQQPGSLPPQQFNGGPSDAVPGQSLGGPVETDPPGTDNWGPYQKQEPAAFPYPSFNQGPSNHLPGQDFPAHPPSEPDNSLEGTNWGDAPQNQPDYLYGMNGPSKFIPGNNFETPMPPPVPEPGTNSVDSQQPPLPSDSGAFSDGPREPPPTDQPVPHDVTEPNFNGPSTPECSDDVPRNNGHGPAPPDSNSGYDPFWNKDPPSAVNYPAGDANAGAEQPMMPPGMFGPPAFESANQVAETYPGEVKQTGPSGFSGPEPNRYPEEGDFIPQSTAPVPDFVTPAYDEPTDYNPEMEYQGLGDYGPGQNAAPNRAPLKPIQVPSQFRNGLPQGKPSYYGIPNPNQGWCPNGLYRRRPQYGPASTGVDPQAIYIPVDPEQSVMLTDPSQDQDSDEFCSCDDCYYDDIVDHKAFRKTACRDLEEARDELKAIFDKIKKKLKCTQKNKCFANM